MVLWEITLATAYFLGLKRTYRLALRIQRRLITQNHPKIRQFAHRRTRAIFDMALKVHYNIQQRDLDMGRNLGNWILRWLDRAKPSAHIRAPPDPPSKIVGSSTSMTKRVTNPTQHKTPPNNSKPGNQEPGRHLFTSYRNAWPKPLTGISMMRVPKPLGTMFQYRQICASSRHSMGGFEGGLRKDIVQWMQRS